MPKLRISPSGPTIQLPDGPEVYVGPGYTMSMAEVGTLVDDTVQFPDEPGLPVKVTPNDGAEPDVVAVITDYQAEAWLSARVVVSVRELSLSADDYFCSLALDLSIDDGAWVQIGKSSYSNDDRTGRTCELNVPISKGSLAPWNVPNTAKKLAVRARFMRENFGAPNGQWIIYSPGPTGTVLIRLSQHG